MKSCLRLTLLALAALCSAITSATDSVDDRVEAMLSKMSLEEKISMCHGATDFATPAIPRLGLPAWQMDDGPGGVRGNPDKTSTYFPTGVGLASTWDREIARREGVAIAQEARAWNLNVVLGPAVNMVRTPLCGRDFEYMSEDPFLAGQLAVGYIQGVQSQGVAACVKHFAANSQEQDRGTVDAQVSERALREIYLPAFEAAVKEGHVLSVMAAYNKLNGTYCSENEHLLRDILKNEWGFRGTVMSDWGAVHSTLGPALHGLDLEMPGNGPKDFMADPLLEAVKSGKVAMEFVDDKVRRTLRARFTAELSERKGKAEINSPAHQKVAREVAEEGIVLMKNEREVLPLGAGVRSIAVIGPWAGAKHGGSGGSSAVFPPYEITALEALKKRCGDKVRINYVEGVGFGTANLRQLGSAMHPRHGSSEVGLVGEYFANAKFEGAPKLVRTDKNIQFNWNQRSAGGGFPRENFSVRWSGVVTAPVSGLYQLGTSSDDGSRVFVDGKLVVDNWGDHGVETVVKPIQLKAGEEHAIKIEFYQGGGEASMRFGWQMPSTGVDEGIRQAAEAAAKSDVAILFVGTNHSWDTEGRDKPSMKLMGQQDQLVAAVAKANPRSVVVLINGSPVEMPWLRSVPAIVEAWYPGMEGGTAIAEILFGDVNPSGKLPVTFPVRLEDSPAHANGNYPGKNLKLKYDEDILVGYRYFDTKKVKPAFPFGHGLSYTTFKYGPMSVSTSKGRVTASLSVTNRGKRAGAEVVQFYIAHPNNPQLLRPEKELKGFQRVFLKAGETKQVRADLDNRAFAYYSVSRKAWISTPGGSKIMAGSSSRDIHATASMPPKG